VANLCIFAGKLGYAGERGRKERKGVEGRGERRRKFLGKLYYDIASLVAVGGALGSNKYHLDRTSSQFSGSGAFLPPGPGSSIHFSRIQDPG
jgi:hypothetical protein